MSDIVERLLNRAANAVIIKDKPNLYYDAAHEIECLRSRIEGAEEAYVCLDASMGRLKSAFLANMLRAFPHMSHDEIDAEIAAAIRGEK